MLTFLFYAHSESQHFHHSKHNDFIYISFIWFRIYIPTFHDMITYMQNRVWIINHDSTPTIPCFTYICYTPRSIIAYTKENQYPQLVSFIQTSFTSRTIYPFLLNFHFLSFFLCRITRRWESSINNKNPSSNQPINALTPASIYHFHQTTEINPKNPSHESITFCTIQRMQSFKEISHVRFFMTQMKSILALTFASPNPWSIRDTYLSKSTSLNR